MELKKYKLGEIAYFVEDKISSDDVSLSEYITTDCLLQNKKGRTIAQNLPPKPCSLTKFKKGDVLIGNIRPYLKKIWFADINGGCSPDVLALRAKNEKESSYLYSLLLQDDFYDFVMKAAKGSKMPRGDKKHILTFPCFDIKNKTKIGDLLSKIDQKIALNRRINTKLETIAKRLYDYWFVQFDFPDANGNPYKSSGCKMVWNDALKREIPEGWEVGNICMIADILSGGTPSKANARYWENGTLPFFGPTDYNGNVFQIETSEYITEDGLKHCASSLFEEGVIIITARGSIGKLIIVGTPMAMNQSCYALRSKTGEYEYLYFLTTQLIDCLKAKGSGSVFKSINTLDIENSLLCVADAKTISKFCSMVKPLLNKIKESIKETARLTALRDKLLPLLMNGQVEVA